MRSRHNLADRLLKKHVGQGRKKVSTRNLTRAQRLAIAPRPSQGPKVKYLKAIMALILLPLQKEIRAKIFPLLATIATPEVKTDTGPNGYEGNSNFSAAFDALEVTVTEVTRDPRLIHLLREVAQGVSQANASELGRLLELDVAKDNVANIFMDGFIRDNVNLIKSIARNQLDRVHEIVTTAHQGQQSYATLAKDLEKTFDISRNRAVLIARDQTLKANADFTRVRQTRAGVTQYVWSCSKDEKVRGRPGGAYPNPTKTGREVSDHWRLDGQVFNWNDPPITNEATGVTNHPGQDYQCRCAAIPVLDGLL